jgi:hypothetical protein
MRKTTYLVKSSVRKCPNPVASKKPVSSNFGDDFDAITKCIVGLNFGFFPVVSSLLSQRLFVKVFYNSTIVTAALVDIFRRGRAVFVS